MESDTEKTLQELREARLKEALRFLLEDVAGRSGFRSLAEARTMPWFAATYWVALQALEEGE